MSDDRPRGVRIIRYNGEVLDVDAQLVRTPSLDLNGVRTWVVPVAEDVLRDIARIEFDVLPARTQVRVMVLKT